MARSKRVDSSDLFKDQICDEFVKYLQKAKITQAELARQLSLNKALMSKIIRKQFSEFSIERLLKLLEKIRPDLTPALKKTRPKPRK